MIFCFPPVFFVRCFDALFVVIFSVVILWLVFGVHRVVRV